MLAGHDLEPQRLSTPGRPRSRDRATQPGAPEDGRAGLHRHGRGGAVLTGAAARRRRRSRRPRRTRLAPYFTSWLRQQLVDKYGAGEAFGGGLDVTLDARPRAPAGRPQEIAYNRTAGVGLSSAVVVLDNNTGGVRAMVGGYDYREQPFNLATQGHRQPGSAFKPFTLVTALEQGISPDEVFTSQPKTFPFKVQGRTRQPQQFRSHNYNDQYLGSPRSRPRRPTPTTRCTPSWARRSGPRTSPRPRTRWASRRPDRRTNPAMILGGSRDGRHPARDGARLPDPGRTTASGSAARWPAFRRRPIAIPKVRRAPGTGGDWSRPTRRPG